MSTSVLLSEEKSGDGVEFSGERAEFCPVLSLPHSYSLTTQAHPQLQPLGTAGCSRLGQQVYARIPGELTAVTLY